MSDIPHVRDLAFEYEVVQTVSPRLRRVVARNPGPFTAQGSGTYIVGRGNVAVIDPGPDLVEHVDALLNGLRGETITHQLITHTHLDHSPAAAAVKAATGAITYGYGPHGTKAGETSEAGADFAFVPDVPLKTGDAVTSDGWTLRAVHTPGHASNHLCFAFDEERILFTGDHVMGWSTTVISPPDGDMTAYMNSLALLLDRDDEAYVPTHGPAIPNPKRYVRALIGHRRQRSAGILRELAKGPRTIPEIVAMLYRGLDPRLVTAAGRSVLSHLLALIDSGQVTSDGEPGVTAIFRLKA